MRLTLVLLLSLASQLFSGQVTILAQNTKPKAKPVAEQQEITIGQQANEINRIQKNAYQLLETHLKTHTEEHAISIVLDYLRKEPFVKKAGVSQPTAGHGMPGIWVTYQNGMEGGVTYRKPGYK
jgi:hypothetical protein